MTEERVKFIYDFELKGERSVERSIEGITKQVLAGRSAMDITAFAVEKLGRVFHLSLGTAVGAAVAGLAIEKFSELGEKVIETRKQIEELSETPVEFLSPEKAAQNLEKIKGLIKNSDINQVEAVAQGAGKFAWDLGRSINKIIGNDQVPKWEQKSIDKAKLTAGAILDQQIKDQTLAAQRAAKEDEISKHALSNKFYSNSYLNTDYYKDRSREREMGGSRAQEKIDYYSEQEAQAREKLSALEKDRAEFINAGIKRAKTAEEADANTIKIKERTLEYEKRREELAKDLRVIDQKKLEAEVEASQIRKDQNKDAEKSGEQLESLTLRRDALTKQIGKTAESIITKRIAEYRPGRNVAIGGNLSQSDAITTGFDGGSGLRSGTREYGHDAHGLLTAGSGRGMFRRSVGAANNFPVNATNLSAVMSANDPLKQQLHELKEINRNIQKLAGAPLPAAN